MPTPDFLPIVEGRTETIRDTQSTESQLATLLGQRGGNADQEASNTISSLERWFAVENSERMRARISASLSLLRDGPSD